MVKLMLEGTSFHIANHLGSNAITGTIRVVYINCTFGIIYIPELSQHSTMDYISKDTQVNVENLGC